MFLIYYIIGMLIPIVIIVLIVKGIQAIIPGANNKSKTMSEKDLAIGSLSVLAAVVAMMFAYVLPDALLDTVGDTEEFTIRLGVAIIYILFGVVLKRNIGKTLLITGVLLAAMQTPYIFSNFGDASTFVILLVAFIALIYFGVRYGKEKR